MEIDTYFAGFVEFDREIPQEVVDKINAKIPRWDYTNEVKENRDWPWTVDTNGIYPDEGDTHPSYGWNCETQDELDDEGTSLLKVINWLLEEIPDLKIDGRVQIEWSYCESEQMLLNVKDGKVFKSYGHIEFGEEVEVK